MTVIPSESREALRATAPGLGIEPADIDFKPLDHDSRFCEVTIRGADKHKMVALITSLFNQGSITVLVGTTSLLGEGWDAPSVNSLILASFVGSYMLSNQMRGRAIRTQDGNPTKTANIWHLVCQEEGRQATQRGHGDLVPAFQIVRWRLLHEQPDRERPGPSRPGRAALPQDPEWTTSTP